MIVKEKRESRNTIMGVVGIMCKIRFKKINKTFKKLNRGIDFSKEVWYNKSIIIPRGIYMAVSYNKLWKLLIDKGMTKTELRVQTDMSTATLAKMSKNEVVSMDVMLRICKVLDCNVGDIMDATKE